MMNEKLALFVETVAASIVLSFKRSKQTGDTVFKYSLPIKDLKVVRITPQLKALVFEYCNSYNIPCEYVELTRSFMFDIDVNNVTRDASSLITRSNPA